jgi:hypothetical protein
MNLVRCAVATALTASVLAVGATTAADAAPHGAAYFVTAGVKKDAPELGDTIKIKGTVTPRAPRQSVRIQVRYADQKKWKTLGTARLDSHSNFTYKDKIGSVRERKYRVVKPASDGHRAGTSAKVDVTSYGWRSLTTVPTATSSGIYKASTVSMNAIAYPDSLLQSIYLGSPNPGTVDYNLGRKCVSFRGRVGLSDSSPAAGTAAITLLKDGVAAYSGSFGLTQSADVTLDVTNAFRLTVSSASTAGGLGAVGTPEVLCSF